MRNPDPRLEGILFPNTPIQIEEENGEWHIYVEGQWHARLTDAQRYPNKAVPEDTNEEMPFDDFAPKRMGKMVRKADVLFLEVRRLVALHGDDWRYPSTRINPEWEKWSEVNLSAITEIYNDEVERRTSATKGGRKK